MYKNSKSQILTIQIKNAKPPNFYLPKYLKLQGFV